MYFSFRVSKIEPFEDNIGENMNAFELGWQNGGILQRKEYEIISNAGRIVKYSHAFCTVPAVGGGS